MLITSICQLHLTYISTGARAIIKVSGHQYGWLAGGYDLKMGYFLEVASMVVTWWIMCFFVCAVRRSTETTVTADCRI